MVERDPTAGTLWRLGCLHRRSDCTELPIRQRQKKKKKKNPDEPQPKHATDPQTHTADSHSSSWTHHAPLINVLPDRVSLIMSFWIFFYVNCYVANVQRLFMCVCSALLNSYPFYIPSQAYGKSNKSLGLARS